MSMRTLVFGASVFALAGATATAASAYENACAPFAGVWTGRAYVSVCDRQQLSIVQCVTVWRFLLNELGKSFKQTFV